MSKVTLGSGSSKNILEGRYNLTNTGQWQHVSGYPTILICTRKKLSGNKPLRFIVQITPEGSRKYLSSLYPINSTDEWNAEYQGIRYRVSSTGGQGSNSYVYHMEFVSKTEQNNPPSEV